MLFVPAASSRELLSATGFRQLFPANNRFFFLRIYIYIYSSFLFTFAKQQQQAKREQQQPATQDGYSPLGALFNMRPPNSQQQQQVTSSEVSSSTSSTTNLPSSGGPAKDHDKGWPERVAASSLPSGQSLSLVTRQNKLRLIRDNQLIVREREKE